MDLPSVFAIWTRSLYVTSELPFNHTKYREEPEEEQDILTEPPYSYSSVTFEVAVTSETNAAGRDNVQMVSEQTNKLSWK